MNRTGGRTSTGRAFGLLVSLCLLIQPLLVPLHLFLVEHCYDHPGTRLAVSSLNHGQAHARGFAHAHADADAHDQDWDRDRGHGHAHDHDHEHGANKVLIQAGGGGDTSGDDWHPPHPDEEHCYELPQLTTPAAQQFQTMALPAYLESLVQPALPSARACSFDPGVPQQIPALASAQPRAPPAIV